MPVCTRPGVCTRIHVCMHVCNMYVYTYVPSICGTTIRLVFSISFSWKLIQDQSNVCGTEYNQCDYIMIFTIVAIMLVYYVTVLVYGMHSDAVISLSRGCKLSVIPNLRN